MRLFAFLAVALAACTPAADAPAPASADVPDRHAYVWAGGMDSTVADQLLVVDADSASATYGQVVGSVEVGTRMGMPHHLERRVSADGRLLANTWVANTSWLFDVSSPRAPTVHASLKGASGTMAWAHDFARLPNGNILVAYNAGPGDYVGAGGLAELDRDGAVVQAAVAKSSEAGDTAMTPYTVHPVPGRDRALVGLGEMGMGPEYKYHETSALQLWSTAPLAPLALIPLPANGKDRGHVATSTVAATANGAMLANTFYCGLYHVNGLDGDTPSATRVFTFPGGTDETLCAVATTVGNYWIQAVAALPGVMVLDVSDPASPREVARLVVDGARFAKPHWVSANRSGTRLAITGEGTWVLMARFDPATGAIAIDSTFRDAGSTLPGITVRTPSGGMLHPHGVAWGP
ncbi:MAG: hypothetical protein SFU84_06480 [Gemmatimonadales bacterium]|nr:hypothetical protein [Gemmatimonadales bacterium]